MVTPTRTFETDDDSDDDSELGRDIRKDNERREDNVRTIGNDEAVPGKEEPESKSKEKMLRSGDGMPSVNRSGSGRIPGARLIRLFMIRGPSTAGHWEDARAIVGRMSMSTDDTIHTVGDGKSTFLHVVCKNDPPVDIVQSILDVSPKSAMRRDSKGMLPLHIAAAFSASMEVVKTLIHSYHDAIYVQDGEMLRLPLHYLFDQQAPISSMPRSRLAHRYQTKKHREMPHPDIVRVLLCPKVLHVEDTEGHSPALLFLFLCRTVGPSDSVGRLSARAILNLFLDCRPEHSDHFTKCMLSNPQWVLEHAFDHPWVKEVMSNRSAEPMCTSILLLDIAVQGLLIVSFHWATYSRTTHVDSSVLENSEYFRYFGILYLFLRLIIEVGGFAKLGKVHVWLRSFWNWVQFANITLLLASTILMHVRPDDFQSYRTLVTLTGGLQWFALLPILSVTSVPFSVFLTGVANILVNLIPFIVTTLILLGAFAYMYYTLNYDAEECRDLRADGEENFDADAWSERGVNYCTNDSAWMYVYVMFIGDIGSSDFESNRPTMWLSVVFALLMVVLQLHVLIAVITDSYVFVKSRGETVFWCHRFYFLADVESVSGLLMRCCFCIKEVRLACLYDRLSESFRRKWDCVVWTLFDESDAYSVEKLSVLQRAGHSVLQFLRLVFLFLWLVFGLVTLGWFWPPQVREYIFAPCSLQREAASDLGDAPAAYSVTVKDHGSDAAGNLTDDSPSADLMQRLDSLETSVQEELRSQREKIDQMQSMLQALASGISVKKNSSTA